MAVNTEKDDMKRAIAKLGGIQLEGNGKQAAYLFGAMAKDAHADRQFNFVPGVGQVFKRAAGLDVDRVISYLVELDYLESDDLTEFEEKLRRIIGGAVIWSTQKSEYDYDMEAAFMAQFEAPDDEETPEEVSTLTAEKEDAWGDIMAFLMGDTDELETEPYDLYELPTNSETREAPQVPMEATNSLTYSQTPEQGTNSQTGHELPDTARTPQRERIKSRSAWINKRLTGLSPPDQTHVKRLLIETLENMERKRNIDLTAEKRDVSDA